MRKRLALTGVAVFVACFGMGHATAAPRTTCELRTIEGSEVVEGAFVAGGSAAVEGAFRAEWSAVVACSDPSVSLDGQLATVRQEARVRSVGARRFVGRSELDVVVDSDGVAVRFRGIVRGAGSAGDSGLGVELDVDAQSRRGVQLRGHQQLLVDPPSGTVTSLRSEIFILNL